MENFLQHQFLKRDFQRMHTFFVTMLLVTMVLTTLIGLEKPKTVSAAYGSCSGSTNPCSILGGDYGNIDFWGRWVIDSGNNKSATIAAGTYFAFSFIGARKITINAVNTADYYGHSPTFHYKLISSGSDSLGCQTTNPCLGYSGTAGVQFSKPGGFVDTNTYTMIVYPDAPFNGGYSDSPLGTNGFPLSVPSDRNCNDSSSSYAYKWYHPWFDKDTAKGDAWTLSDITLEGATVAPQLRSGFITNSSQDSSHISFPNVSIEFIADSLASGNPSYATETGFSLYGYNGVTTGFSSFGMGSRGVSWGLSTYWYSNNTDFTQPRNPNNTSTTDPPSTYNSQFYCEVPPAVSSDLVSGSRTNYYSNSTVISNLSSLNQRQPNVVVIELGDDDYIHGVRAYPSSLTDYTSQSYRNDLINFINTVYSQYSQPQIYVIAPLPCNSSNLAFNGLCDSSGSYPVYYDTGTSHSTYHEAASDAVYNTRISNSTNKIHFLDLNQAITTTTDLADGVHLNNSGATHLAQALTACIGHDFSSGGDNGTAQNYTWLSSSSTCYVP